MLAHAAVTFGNGTDEYLDAMHSTVTIKTFSTPKSQSATALEGTSKHNLQIFEGCSAEKISRKYLMTVSRT